MTNPVFKTFYNHRIFVIYNPEDYRQYLLRIVDQREWPDSEKFGLKLGLMAWGTILVYQARMVASDFHRRLKGLVDADGAFLYQNPSLPLSRPLYRQQLAMQLGIEVIARAPEVKERIEEAPIVAQYVYDTLYMPSFYHENGRGETSAEGSTTAFTVTRDVLREHLWLRSGGKRVNTEAKDADEARTLKDFNDFIAPATLDYLFKAVLNKYFELLFHPKDIQEKTRQYASELPPAERRFWLALADVVDDEPLLTSYQFGRLEQKQQSTANGGAPSRG